jgi:glutamine---fructose-6-phosphate transaminase (isomerizing)
MSTVTVQVTVLALLSLWFRQLREAEVNKLDGALTLPEKHHLLEALQRLPISFGMAMRVRYVWSLTAVYIHLMERSSDYH